MILGLDYHIPYKKCWQELRIETSYYYHSPEHHFGEKKILKEREDFGTFVNAKSFIKKIQLWKNDTGNKSIEYDVSLLDF